MFQICDKPSANFLSIYLSFCLKICLSDNRSIYGATGRKRLRRETNAQVFACARQLPALRSLDVRGCAQFTSEECRMTQHFQ